MFVMFCVSSSGPYPKLVLFWRGTLNKSAMGFWAALDEVYPETGQQRCWMHKTMNILNCLPKSVQPKAKQALHAIWQAETQVDAEKAFDLFINRAKWDAQSSKVRAVITAAAAAVNGRRLCYRMAHNSTALAKLTDEHGVQLRQFPDELLKELALLSDKVVREHASQEKLSEEILTSIIEFRKNAAKWAAVSEQPYLEARSTIL